MEVEQVCSGRGSYLYYVVHVWVVGGGPLNGGVVGERGGKGELYDCSDFYISEGGCEWWEVGRV